MYETPTLLCLAAMVGGFIRGFSGFGGPMIIIPILNLFYPPSLSIWILAQTCWWGDGQRARFAQACQYWPRGNDQRYTGLDRTVIQASRMSLLGSRSQR